MTDYLAVQNISKG